VAGGILTAPTGSMVDAVNIKVGGLLRLTRAVDGRLAAGSRIVAIGGHYGFEPTAYAASAGWPTPPWRMWYASSAWPTAPGRDGPPDRPGPADTERLRRVAADRAALSGISVDEVMAGMLAESSIGRFTTPEQVAWAVSILLAPEADAMTGSSLMLTGRRRGLP
jgi:hypothetical protein